jgi:MerR family transcriptional regulator, light-induced transcriptional regulator
MALHIAAVERETGLGKDTLRVWERRYGFPQPLRNANGERIYPSEQVRRLHTIKRLLDQGLRPRHVVSLEAQALMALAAASEPPTFCERPVGLNEFLATHWDHIKAHQAAALRQSLTHDLLRMGALDFIARIVTPLSQAIGEAWAQGQIEIHEEHLYTETVVSVLRQAMAAANDQPAADKPVVLLTTLPVEPHALGLLMAQTALTLAGANCVALGPQTPVFDIAKAAQAHGADVVALSFSAFPVAKAVTDGVLTLRASLPAAIELWVGGSHPSLPGLARDGVAVLSELGEVESSIQAWRTRMSATPTH